MNTMNNGVFDAVEIDPNRAERQQRAQRDGLLTAAALVQALRWEDVEGPVIKDQGVGFCPVRLGVVAEDIQVRLPLQLPVVPEVWVPGAVWPLWVPTSPLTASPPTPAESPIWAAALWTPWS